MNAPCNWAGKEWPFSWYSKHLQDVSSICSCGRFQERFEENVLGLEGEPSLPPVPTQAPLSALGINHCPSLGVNSGAVFSCVSSTLLQAEAL